MTNEEQNHLWETLFLKVREIFSDAPACHDLSHTLRVLKNARMLLENEQVQNSFAVEVAALLHDVARPEELASSGKICHAREGALKAERLLRESGCNNEEFIHLVAESVRTHRYRGTDLPSTPEARIVYDADKLDSLGAIGIARAFHFAGRIGACLHNSAETALASESYSREDSAYREYLVKLRYLPEKMLTESGKHHALSRASFMDLFFEKMNSP